MSTTNDETTREFIIELGTVDPDLVIHMIRSAWYKHHPDAARQDAEETQAAIATLTARMDVFCRTAGDRRTFQDLCEQAQTNWSVAGRLVDWANALSAPAEYIGVKVSPGANPEPASADELAHVPILAAGADGQLTIRVGRNPSDHAVELLEERIQNPPQAVREIVRLRRRGLVILDTDEETFVMTEEEFSQQV